jgi:hypothetical protein
MTETPHTTAFRRILPEQAAVPRDDEPATDPAVPVGNLSTPEAVVAALYDALSGPAEQDQPRDWRRFRALLLPGARFLVCRWQDEAGRRVPDLREWDADGFITDAKSAYRSAGFWEREIAGRTERFGGIAHRFSTYESRVGSEESEPAGRGINSIQLVEFGGRWWIASVVWDFEAPDQPIPAEYL